MRRPSPSDDRDSDADSDNSGALPELVTESFGEVEEFSGAAGEVIEIQLWACNLPSFAVFRLCRITGIGVGGGMAPGFVHWSGIPPEQIQAACNLCCVPRAQRHMVADDVSHMGDRVSSERNRLQNSKR